MFVRVASVIRQLKSFSRSSAKIYARAAKSSSQQFQRHTRRTILKKNKTKVVRWANNSRRTHVYDVVTYVVTTVARLGSSYATTRTARQFPLPRTTQHQQLQALSTARRQSHLNPLKGRGINWLHFAIQV